MNKLPAFLVVLHILYIVLFDISRLSYPQSSKLYSLIPSFILFILYLSHSHLLIYRENRENSFFI